MVEPARKRATYAEYLAIANDSAVKYEYVAGDIVAMSGGTIAHARLIARCSALLERGLESGPCIVLPSDARVRIRAADRATYPDLHVVCGAVEHDPEDNHAVVNPTVIVEVLSDSTADGDRTEKFAAYRRLKSLREYVLVSQRTRRVEIYRRNARSWGLEEYGTGERVRFDSLNLELAVDDIYADRLGVIVA